MRKSKRLLALLLAGTMTVAGLSACSKKDDNENKKTDSTPTPTQAGSQTPTDGAQTPTDAPSGDGEKITLTVWAPQEDQAPRDGYSGGILSAMCEAFDEAHPEWDITFQYGVCSEGEAKTQVAKDPTAAADVYMYANDQLSDLVASGAISKFGGSNLEFIQNNYDQSMIDSVTYEGGVYGVPFTPNTWFMYYNKGMYTEEEVKSLDAMMAKDLGDGVFNVAFPLTNSWYIAAFYYAGGGQLFGPNGSDEAAGTNFGELSAVTEYLVDLKANPKFSVENNGSSIALMKEGKLGAYFTGSWDAEAIKTALGDNFAATQCPTVTINGTTGQMKSFAGSKAIGVNANSKNMQAAVALAIWLGGEECQKIRFTTRGITPTFVSLKEDPEVQADVVAYAQALEISNASVVQPLIAKMQDYWTPAETLGKEIDQGDVTKENAAEKTKNFGDAITNAGL